MGVGGRGSGRGRNHQADTLKIHFKPDGAASAYCAKKLLAHQVSAVSRRSALQRAAEDTLQCA